MVLLSAKLVIYRGSLGKFRPRHPSSAESILLSLARQIRPPSHTRFSGSGTTCRTPASHFTGLNVYFCVIRQATILSPPHTHPIHVCSPCCWASCPLSPLLRRACDPFPVSTGARGNLGQHEAVLRGLCQGQPAPYPVHVPAQPQVPRQGQVRMTLTKTVKLIYESQANERTHIAPLSDDYRT